MKQFSDSPNQFFTTGCGSQLTNVIYG